MPRTRALFQQVPARPTTAMFDSGPMAALGGAALRIEQGPLAGLGVQAQTQTPTPQ